MSLTLYTPGDGILKTHVTWEDIESEVQEALKTQAKFGENKNAINLSYGKGFLSRIVKITPNWENVKSDEKLPECIVVKIASFMNGVEMIEQLKSIGKYKNFDPVEHYKRLDKACKEVHNNECKIYEYIRSKNLSLSAMPEVFASRQFDENNQFKAYIIMNFIPSDDVNLYDNVKFDELKPVLKAIAEYSAIGEEMSDATKSMHCRKMYSQVFGTNINEQSKREHVETLRKFDNGSLGDIIEDYEKFYFEGYTKEKMLELDSLSERFNMNEVLIHGDLHTMNLMFKRDEKGGLQLNAVVDYQSTHFNCPALDLTRLMVSTLSGKDRRHHYEEIIETYFRYFVEAIGHKPIPYKLEQLKSACDWAMPYGVMKIVSSIQPLYEAVASKNPTDKELILDRIREKVRAMVEDAIYYYQKTQRNHE